MARGGKNVNRLITVAIFIVLEIAAFSLLRSTSSLQNIWINRFSHRVMAGLWGSGESIRGYFSLKKQNDALAEENYQLREELRDMKAQFPMMDNTPMVKLRTEFTFIPATIVKMSRNSQHNYIILNKGSDDGVVPQSGIVTANGVVGIVDAVDRHYSYGLTLMNSKTSVSARVGSSGMVAPLTWDGRSMDGAILKDIPLHTQVAPGDTIWTSGLSSIFPGGIPLGIAGKTHLEGGASSRVSVKLFQDFSALRYVSITNNPLRNEIESLEKSEEKGGRR